MNAILPYMFKAGFSITVLFLIYSIFLRRETFFRFNRYYLFGSLVFSLLIPLMPISIDISRASKFTLQIENIIEYRKQYEQLWQEFEEISPESLGIYIYSSDQSFEDVRNQPGFKTSTPERSLRYYVSLIYFAGVCFFLIRFLLMMFSLLRFISKCKIKRMADFKLALSPEPVSPFAFGKYLVVHQNFVNSPEFKPVLSHEAVHIRQFHSHENILMELVLIFGWFQPFFWLHRSAIKENHEFLADQGALIRKDSNHQLYKEVILKQLISTTFFELANSLNFKPIKRRIKMMSKSKSRKGARLKVLAAIPLAALLFLLFANLTVNKNGVNLMNSTESPPCLEGIWKLQNSDGISNLIGFDCNTLHIIEPDKPIAFYNYKLEANYLVLEIENGIKVRFEEKGDLLSIWWAESKASNYVKSKSTNSFDLFQKENNYSIDPVELTQYRILEKSSVIWTLVLDGKKDPALFLNNEKMDFPELRPKLKNLINATSAFDLPFITVLIYADNDLPMKYLLEVRKDLRELDLLKVGYGGVPADNCPKVLYHAVALARKLPFRGDDNFIKSKEEIMESGTYVFENDGRDISENDLREIFGKYDKVIFALNYEPDLSYGKYIASNETIQKVIFDFREEYAQEQFGMKYVELPDVNVKMIKVKYPLMISEAELD
ncbi:MAG: M56 family metallopeptidase [Bacteroidales bacterium]|nr:M56 family metallopeptidase [Bacteroidales bacterium]MCF8458032.1 M56 family metallopeptidase [Bacteroidales bacterium]